jgi:hypothetical protein
MMALRLLFSFHNDLMTLRGNPLFLYGGLRKLERQGPRFPPTSKTIPFTVTFVVMVMA